MNPPERFWHADTQAGISTARWPQGSARLRRFAARGSDRLLASTTGQIGPSI